MRPSILECYALTHVLRTFIWALLSLIGATALIAQPRYDLLLKGGQVIDPRNSINARITSRFQPVNRAHYFPRYRRQKPAQGDSCLRDCM